MVDLARAPAMEGRPRIHGASKFEIAFVDSSPAPTTPRRSQPSFLADKPEVDGSWCYVWETTSTCAPAGGRVTNPLNADSDGDGLLDGQEIGRTSAGVDTLVAVFKADSDPSSTTNPNAADTDADGLSDRLEDANLNGRVDSGEPNPTVWDTDNDGLCDGNCSGKGEDKNLNGIRDQDPDGNYTETDFLANDSDVDGILDGQETNGTWSYKNGTAGCPGEDKNPCKLNALNPDFDGDGLRDGQETAGWMVGIWYERTMEKKVNYTVNSNPADPTTDVDALTDFEEFMNGSDPRALDTDKDGINDTVEIERKSNITGIEGSPPRIENVTLNVGITWEWWGLLYLPSKATVTVSFNVSDNVGIAYVDVKFTRYTGSESRKVAFSTNPATFVWSSHISQVFEFSVLEALVAGADVNITAYDVNGNGAWGEFHVKSVVEAVVEAITALFSAIAKVIVEAASALIGFVLDMIKSLLDAAIRPIVDALNSIGRAFLAPFVSQFPTGAFSRSAPYDDAVANAITFGILFVITMSIIVALVAIGVMTDIWGAWLLPFIQPISEMMTKGIIGGLAGFAVIAVGTGVAALFLGFMNPTASLTDRALTGMFGWFQANTDPKIWTAIGITASLAGVFLTVGAAIFIAGVPAGVGGLLDLLALLVTVVSIFLAVISTTVSVQTNKEMAVALALASLWLSLIGFMLSVVGAATITISTGGWRLALAGQRILMIISVTLGLFGVFYDYTTFRGIWGSVPDWTRYWSCNRDPTNCG